jgi:hypothetical protein
VPSSKPFARTRRRVSCTMVIDMALKEADKGR